MEVEFQGQYDRASLFRAVALANQPSRRGAILRIGLATLILVVYVVYFVHAALEDTSSTFDILRAGRHLVTMLIFAGFLLWPYISSRFTASKIWKGSSVQCMLTGRISSEGTVVLRASGAQEETPWERFAKKRISDDLIVLLTADGILFMFQRNFFKTDRDWQRVKQWVNFEVLEAKGGF